jgi:hypothetical protein
MMDGDGDVVGVTSVLDPSVDEASDWTLHVLGTLASHMAMLLRPEAVPEAGPSGGSTTDPALDGLGRDVLRLVEAWQSAGQSAGQSGVR